MKRRLLFIAVLVCALVAYGNLYGQMIGGSSFLKNSYLEIGIAPNGSMGGGPPVPGGYHPSGSLNSIGAMYDWGHDGWIVGTPPSFGEFTMLGSPFEGWSMQANGVRYDAYYTMGLGTGSSFSPGLSGSNVSWSNAGGVMTNVWQGSAAGLTIRQKSTIEAGESWMTTTVSMVNTTGSSIPGVYFWRSVDSDGDPASPINYNTVNRIIYQNDALHRSLVVAEGVSYTNARFAYGAIDARAKVMIYEQWAPYPADVPGNSLDKVYNQTITALGFTSYNVGGTSPAAQDIAVGIIFNLGTIAAGDSAVFRYATLFGDTTTVDSIAPVHNITGPAAVCAGSTISLTDPLPGGSWTSSNTSIATVNATGLVRGVSAGNVTISYTLSSGSVTHNVTVGAGIPSISGTTTVCTGFTPTLTGTPAGGVWASSNTSVATVAQTGVYGGVSGGTAIISYNNGCGIATRTVTINKRPVDIYGATVVAIAAKVYLCPGGITTLSNDGYPVGGWSSSNSVVATVNSISGVLSSSGMTGTTSVTAMNLCGGNYVDLIVAAPTAISGNLVLCSPVSTTTLSNGTKPGTWTSGNTAVATIEPSTGIVHAVPGATGVVPITYTFAGGCSRDTTLVVTASPGSITGGSTVCIGVPLALSNAVGAGTWSSGATAVATVNGTTGVVTGVAAGTAVLTYATACGMATTTVTVSTAGYIDAGTATVCVGATIALSNATPGGSWSTMNTSLATVTTGGALTGVATGITTVTYTLSSCALHITTVTVLPAPNVGVISGPSMVCVGSTEWLTDAVAGGVWSSSNTLKAVVGSNGAVTGIDTGMVTISYTITGMCGAVSATKTIMVNDIIDPGIILGSNRVCEGAFIALSNAVTFGSWSSGNSGVAIVNAAGIVTGVGAGTVVISYSIISNSCGVTTATMTVTVDAAPNAGIISGLDSVCPGAVMQLSETVAGGTWSSGNVAVASILNASTGRVHAVGYGVVRISYTVVGGAGCSSVAAFTLAVTPPPFTINALVNDVTCYGAKNGSVSVTIGGTAPVYHFLWSTGAVTSSITGLDSGFYILNVNEPMAQCIADTAFTIKQPPAMVVKDSATADFCNIGTGVVVLDVSGGVPGYSYLWSGQQTTKDIQNLHAGVYSVIVTDMNSCTLQHTAVVADSVCKNIVIHDVITPNGDGLNDVWVIEGITGYKQNTVQIFDKWGDKIYEQSNYQNDWSGMGKNGLLPDGTYYYLVKLNALANGGGPDTFTGSLLIKR